MALLGALLLSPAPIAALDDPEPVDYTASVFADGGAERAQSRQAHAIDRAIERREAHLADLSKKARYWEGRLKKAKAAAKKAERTTARSTVAHAATGTTASFKAYAKERVGAAEFVFLELLWQRESGWNPNAVNASSGAYGIPQALPGTKMATAGADWRTNGYTQIRWGISYIHDVYGSCASAWAHSQAVGWY